MRSKRVWIGGVISGLAFAGIAGYAYGTSPTSNYPTNSSGHTYGTSPIGNSAFPLDDPDLVAVVGIHGRQGYVYSSQLDDPSGRGEPSSPEEALKWQAEAPDHWDIPVYKEDGSTVIDSFKVLGPDLQPGDTQETVEPQPGG